MITAKNIGIPQNLDIHELTSDTVFIEANKNFCLPNQPLQSLYVIENGSAKDFIICENGDEKVTDFYLPGEIIGLEAINSGQHLYHTQTLEPTKISIIPFDKLLRLSTLIPKIQFRMMRLMSQKISEKTRALINTHLRAKQRIAAFLINISERYKNNGYCETDYYLPMSRYDIGSYLNLTTETVSRMLTQLQRENILFVEKKHIMLTNLKNLKERYVTEK